MPGMTMEMERGCRTGVLHPAAFIFMLCGDSHETGSTHIKKMKLRWNVRCLRVMLQGIELPGEFNIPARESDSTTGFDSNAQTYICL